ncbi:hypothetical protein MP638_007422 [Amoeboaphelidium occidentale]|nr:hypothetical protein MP638_007422 [Amoeboaphelidium occidentale]
MSLSTKEANIVSNEKGALAFDTTASAAVDFFFQVVPKIAAVNLEHYLEKSWADDALMTLKLIYQLRDVRDGKNDRENFTKCLLWLFKKHPKTLLANLAEVPVHGYWKDLLELLKRALRGLTLPEDPKTFPKRPENVYHGKKKSKPKKTVRRGRRAVNHVKKENKKEYLQGKDATAAVAAWEKSVHDFNKLCLEKNIDGYADLHDAVAQLFADQLKQDLENMAQKKRVSLAAKWAPSLKNTHDMNTGIAKAIALKLFPAPENCPDLQKHSIVARNKYRKEVYAPLRKYSSVTEVQMSANRWNEIQYSKVHAVSMKKHTNAFKKHDGERFGEYLTSVTKGDAKIAASALLPHEILGNSYYSNTKTETEVEVMNAQWNRYLSDLRKSGTFQSAMAVCDVSGSMSGTPMDVCIALGLLLSDLVEEPFKNQIITFHEKPSIYTLPDGTLLEKAKSLQQAPWGGSTDFVAVFNLILDLAKKHKLKKDQMIKTLFVFSDMQFDFAAGNSFKVTTHQHVKKMFNDAGYEMPQMIYWNLRATGTAPVTAHETGAVLMSGFSGQMLKALLGGETLSTMNILLKAVSGESYARLRVVD